ncbi:peptidylprolyl isomerase [Defluviimonas aestuarii]|uniref:peptidylprolyl isomerase n=1 Tax=Albidovulum aestuarii TaxID=1130726 RepID=UPI00249ACB03|nr:peptidylprolyl isomerase [Defluviimonas aestuarii]MDI3336143.1 peptidylprolyl isomerase [Defluviimonas aestuarii]
MSDTRVFLGAMAVGVVAIGAAAFLYMRNTTGEVSTEDGPGPNLVIEVAGEANGEVVIDLLPEVAPQHVARIVELAESGAYDDVVFHRVIEGFMAQTGDVKFGKYGGDISAAGTGRSDLENVPAEFSKLPFQRGTVGMARAGNPDSANSQFFIMFAEGSFLNGQYTVFGKVVSGMEVVDAIRKGEPDLNGAVTDPDRMVKVTVVK